jgi:6-phosphogluconate dehydrogenase
MSGDGAAVAADLEQALYAAKIIAYAQGFQMIEAGSKAYGWNIDLGAMATIWRGGCIIRARFLDEIRRSYSEGTQAASLLLDPLFQASLESAQGPWRRLVSDALTAGVPVPGFTSALAAYDGVRAERLPTALIQGLRDHFGAHGYRRIDRDGFYHVRWAQDGQEVRTGD